MGPLLLWRGAEVYSTGRRFREFCEQIERFTPNPAGISIGKPLFRPCKLVHNGRTRQKRHTNAQRCGGPRGFGNDD